MPVPPPTAFRDFAESLRGKDVDDLLSGATDFVKKSPVIAVGTAAAIGFVLARLIKSGIDAAADLRASPSPNPTYNRRNWGVPEPEQQEQGIGELLTRLADDAKAFGQAELDYYYALARGKLSEASAALMDRAPSPPLWLWPRRSRSWSDRC
jgi:hypothetical protein